MTVALSLYAWVCAQFLFIEQNQTAGNFCQNSSSSSTVPTLASFDLPAHFFLLCRCLSRRLQW